MSKKAETVANISFEKQLPFQKYPFLVRDDQQMKMIMDIIRSARVLIPAIVRPLVL